MRWRGKVRGEMIEHRGIVRRDRAEASRQGARSMRTRGLGGGVNLISKTYQRRAPDKNKQLKRFDIYGELILIIGL